MNVRIFASTLIMSLLMIGLISSCTLPLPGATVPQNGESGGAQATQANSVTDAAMTEGGAMATVATRSLRVRQDPDEASEVVAGIAAGETYRVIGLSTDGQWIQLAIENTPNGAGWVSANFVTVEGDITDLTSGPTASTATTTTATTTKSTTTASITTTAVTLVPTPQPGFALVRTDGIRLRVRGEPTTDAPIVGYAYDGETYQVVATSGDGLWVQIPPATGDNTDNPDGGWVAAEFLLINQ